MSNDTKKRKIVFIGDYNFPSDMASSIRVYCVAKACLLAGYEPFIIGKGRLPDGSSEIGIYNEIRYTTMPLVSPSFFIKVIEFLKRRRLYIQNLLKYAQDADFIVPYACSCPSQMTSVIRFGKQRNIPVICDISEWYDIRQFEGFIGKINYFVYQYQFRTNFAKCDKMICCSRYVREYFIKQNPNVLIVNGLINVEEIDPKFNVENDRHVFVYAGSPGKKDALLPFIHAIALLDEETRKKIRLIIVGLTKKRISEFERITAGIKNNPIELHERIPRTQLIDIIRNANYSMLLRPPNKRYARSGFPSKLCESMALGTPMMVNISGDIGEYVTDNNAIIIRDFSTSGVKEAIEKAVRIDSHDYASMRKASYKTAVDNFSFQACSKRIDAFIQYGIIKNR
jgi:glycosyltransferase involved in cell wall biosynthesis